MSKEKQVSLKLDAKSALELLQVLDSSTAGYSQKFSPERIVRLREVMIQLDTKLAKVVI